MIIKADDNNTDIVHRSRGGRPPPPHSHLLRLYGTPVDMNMDKSTL